MMRENDARTRTPGTRPYVVSAEAPASRCSVRRVSDFDTASPTNAPFPCSEVVDERGAEVEVGAARLVGQRALRVAFARGHRHRSRGSGRNAERAEAPLLL